MEAGTAADEGGNGGMEARMARMKLGNGGATIVPASARRMTRAMPSPALIRIAAGALCVLPFRHHLIIFELERSERDADAERCD